jgi:rRNA maturation protein Nop10
MVEPFYEYCMSQGELARLIDESDAFTRCSTCGTYIVSPAQHRCSPDDVSGNLRREDRIERGRQDDRSPTDEVGVYARAGGNAYAYHELDEDDTPQCADHDGRTDARLAVVTRREAKQRGKAPCGNCQRVAGGEDSPAPTA